MSPRAVMPLLVVLIAGTAFLPTPAFVLGDAATAGTLACAPGQPCSMPEACEVSALAAIRAVRHDTASDGCCSVELPSTGPGDLPPVDEDACSRCRCFAAGTTAIVDATGFVFVVREGAVIRNVVAERTSRIPAPETPPPRRAL